jgi:hypothetical protein
LELILILFFKIIAAQQTSITNIHEFPQSKPDEQTMLGNDIMCTTDFFTGHHIEDIKNDFCLSAVKL